MKKAFLVEQDITDELYAELVEAPELGVDCEMMGLNPHRDRLCLVQIGKEGGPYVLVQVNDSIGAPKLKSLLENPAIQKIFHFARMDCLFLSVRLKANVQNIFCTKLASRLARTYTDRHGLKELVREFTGEQLDKTITTSDWGNAKLSPEQLKYAEEDIKYLFRIKRKLQEMLERENRFEMYRRSVEFLPVRVRMDELGYDDIFAH
ncbi:MAG: ribonuclease D [Spirochaetia bacterium]|nr:ribonuclease D [Spirochaetia bacterium]